MSKKVGYVVSRELGRVKYRFPNNYGASVIQNEMSYGGAAGMYEIAVLKYHSDDNEDWSIDSTTSVTDDVIGWLHPDKIDMHLLEIKSL